MVLTQKEIKNSTLFLFASTLTTQKKIKKYFILNCHPYRSLFYAQVTHSRTGRRISHGYTFVAIRIGP